MEKIIFKLKEAFEELLNSEEIPVVAIIANDSNEIIAISGNERQATFKICSHAEINVINKVFQINKSKNLKGYKLYTNLEPCKMCVGAIEQTGLNEVYYFVKNEKFGAAALADPRINLTKIDSEESKYFENKMREHFKKLR